MDIITKEIERTRKLNEAYAKNNRIKELNRYNRQGLNAMQEKELAELREMKKMAENVLKYDQNVHPFINGFYSLTRAEIEITREVLENLNLIGATFYSSNDLVGRIQNLKISKNYFTVILDTIFNKEIFVKGPNFENDSTDIIKEVREFEKQIDIKLEYNLNYVEFREKVYPILYQFLRTNKQIEIKTENKNPWKFDF